MPRKPLTPEQRAKKNAKQKQDYHNRRAAGMTPQEAKSKKLAEQYFTKLQAAKKKSKPRKKSSKSKAPVPGVTIRPRVLKSTTDFATFVSYYPNMPARKLIKLYREETGQSISNVAAFRITREVREADKRFEKVRFKMYGNEDNPAKKFFLKDRFMYLVRYEVEVEGQPDTFDQHIYITSSKELTPQQIKEKTLESFQVGQEYGKERYVAKRIDPNTIMIIFGVDTWKKTAAS